MQPAEKGSSGRIKLRLGDLNNVRLLHTLMTPAEGDTVSRILQERCGQWSVVHLFDGHRYRVFDIGWGRDMGDDYHHVTTNVSPGPSGEYTIDFFFTSEVARIEDAATGEVLFECKTPVA